MSTRCQIGFYSERPTKENLNNWESLIYRHSDGYPEGVIPDIQPFLEWWSQHRGLANVEYASARLLQWMCNQYDEAGDYWDKQANRPITPREFTGELGHGICNQFHWDIEFYYVIYPNGIDVYKATFVEDNDPIFTLIQEIKIGQEVVK